MSTVPPSATNERLTNSERAARGEPVAYVVRSLSDGSIGSEIAPVNYLMHDYDLEKLKNDPWVVNGKAEIAPLYLSPVSVPSEIAPNLDADGTLWLDLEADSGYKCSEDHRVTPVQWEKIQRVLHGTEETPLSARREIDRAKVEKAIEKLEAHGNGTRWQAVKLLKEALA